MSWLLAACGIGGDVGVLHTIDMSRPQRSNPFSFAEGALDYATVGEYTHLSNEPVTMAIRDQEHENTQGQGIRDFRLCSTSRPGL